MKRKDHKPIGVNNAPPEEAKTPEINSKLKFEENPIPTASYDFSLLDEALIHIFNYLTPQELAEVGAPHHWRELALNNSLWRRLCEKHFPCHPKENNVSYYEHFSNEYQLQYLSRYIIEHIDEPFEDNSAQEPLKKIFENDDYWKILLTRHSKNLGFKVNIEEDTSCKVQYNNAIIRRFKNIPIYYAVLTGHPQLLIEQLKSQTSEKIAAALNPSLNKLIFGKPWHWFTPLTLAASCDYQIIVNLLISAGANINLQSKHEKTPLYVASEEGREAIVKLLVRNNADVNYLNGLNKTTALYIASEKGHEAIAELLIRNNADVNHINRIDRTALYIASEKGHEAIVKLLVRNNASVNHINRFGHAPLYIASEKGHLKIVEFLIKHKADINQLTMGSTALYVASEKGQLEIVDLLLRKGIDTNLAGKGAQTPLYIASEKGYLKIVKLLIQGGADVNLVDQFDKSPLHVASEKGHVSVVEYLISKGGNVNKINKMDTTPLYEALKNKHEGVASLLTSNGADVNLRKKDGSTLLHISRLMRRGNAAIIDQLIQRGANIDLVNDKGRSALFVASQDGNIDAVHSLIQGGADVNLSDKLGLTPLHAACQRGLVEVAELLLTEGGARIDERAKDGSTPLHLASHQGHPKTVELLIDKKANLEAMDNRHYTPLHLASAVGGGRLYMVPRNDKKEEYLEVVTFLIEAGANVDAVDKYGTTPIKNASYVGDLDIVKLLINKTVNVNPMTGSDFTPLGIASHLSHLEIVKVLIAAGANPNARGRKDSTPLHETEDSVIIRLLVKAGADVNAVDADGYTPLHGKVRYATYDANLMTVALLIILGGDVNLPSNKGKTPLDEVTRPLDYNPKIANLLRTVGGRATDFTAKFHSLFDFNNGKTPLYLAAERGELEVVEWLLEVGADPNEKINSGSTPLSVAIRKKYKDIVALLKEASKRIESTEANSRKNDDLIPDAQEEQDVEIDSLPPLEDDEENETDQSREQMIHQINSMRSCSTILKKNIFALRTAQSTTDIHRQLQCFSRLIETLELQEAWAKAAGYCQWALHIIEASTEIDSLRQWHTHFRKKLTDHAASIPHHDIYRYALTARLEVLFSGERDVLAEALAKIEAHSSALAQMRDELAQPQRNTSLLERLSMEDVALAQKYHKTLITQLDNNLGTLRRLTVRIHPFARLFFSETQTILQDNPREQLQWVSKRVNTLLGDIQAGQQANQYLRNAVNHPVNPQCSELAYQQISELLSFTTIQRHCEGLEFLFAQINFYYQKALAAFTQANPQERERLLTLKAQFYSEQLGHYEVDMSLALKLLDLEEGDVSYNVGGQSIHTVTSIEGNFFKKPGKEPIQSADEYKPYLFYQLLSPNDPSILGPSSPLIAAPTSVFKLRGVVSSDSKITESILQASYGLPGVLLKTLLGIVSGATWLKMSLNEAALFEWLPRLVHPNTLYFYLAQSFEVSQTALDDYALDHLIERFISLQKAMPPESRLLEFRALEEMDNASKKELSPMMGSSIIDAMAVYVLCEQYPTLMTGESLYELLKRLSALRQLQKLFPGDLSEQWSKNIIREAPALLDKIDLRSFQAMGLVSISSVPKDAKSDNIFVRVSYDLAQNKDSPLSSTQAINISPTHHNKIPQELFFEGIDNDVSIGASITQNKTGEKHFCETKCVLYLFEQMKKPLHKDVSAHFLSRSPEAWLLIWLQGLMKEDATYQALIQLGVVKKTPENTRRRHQSSLIENCGIPMLLEIKDAWELYKRVERLHVFLQSHPVASLQELLKIVEPEVSMFYQQLVETHHTRKNTHPDQKKIPAVNAIGCLWHGGSLPPTIEALLKLDQLEHPGSSEKHRLAANLKKNRYPRRDNRENTQHISEAKRLFLRRLQQRLIHSIKTDDSDLANRILAALSDYAFKPQEEFEEAVMAYDKLPTDTKSVATLVPVDIAHRLKSATTVLLYHGLLQNSSVDELFAHYRRCPMLLREHFLSTLEHLAPRYGQALPDRQTVQRVFAPLYRYPYRFDGDRPLLNHLKNVWETHVNQLLGVKTPVKLPSSELSDQIVLTLNIGEKIRQHVLHSEVKTYLIEEGYFNEKERCFQKRENLPGRHIVIPIDLDIDGQPIRLHIKLFPEVPIVDYANQQLAALLLGHSLPYNSLGRIDLDLDRHGRGENPIPVLISQTIPADQEKETLDPQHASENAILSILFNLGDGNESNYVSHQGKRTKIDTGRSHMDSFVVDEKQGYLKPRVMDLLFCSDEIMEQPIDPIVRQALLEIDHYQLLHYWLDSLQKYCVAMADLFDEGDREKLLPVSDNRRGGLNQFFQRLWKTDAALLDKTFLELPFSNQVIDALYHKISTLQEALRREPTLTHQQLFALVEPYLADFYDKVRKRYKRESPQARFYQTFYREYNLPAPKASSQTQSEPQATPSIKATQSLYESIRQPLNKRIRDPVKIHALPKRLEKIHDREYISILVTALMQGDKDAIEEFIECCSFDQEAILARLDFAKIEENIGDKKKAEYFQAQFLEALVDAKKCSTPFKTLTLKNAAKLTDIQLKKLTDRSPLLRKIDISGCTAISENGFITLFKHKALEKIRANDLTQLKHINIKEAYYQQTYQTLAGVAYLEMQRCTDLESIKSVNVTLKKVNLTGCENLSDINDFQAPLLRKIRLTGCAKLAVKDLIEHYPDVIIKKIKQCNKTLLVRLSQRASTLDLTDIRLGKTELTFLGHYFRTQQALKAVIFDGKMNKKIPFLALINTLKMSSTATKIQFSNWHNGMMKREAEALLEWLKQNPQVTEVSGLNGERINGGIQRILRQRDSKRVAALPAIKPTTQSNQQAPQNEQTQPNTDESSKNEVSSHFLFPLQKKTNQKPYIKLGDVHISNLLEPLDVKNLKKYLLTIEQYPHEVRKNTWAKTGGIIKTLQLLLKNPWHPLAHVVDPELSSVHSPLCKATAQVAAENYAIELFGYKNSEGHYINNGIISDIAKWTLPIVMPMNVAPTQAQSSHDVSAEGGLHWVVAVLFPCGYQPENRPAYQHPQMYLIDSLTTPLYSKPTSLITILKSGKQLVQRDEQIISIPNTLPDLKVDYCQLPEQDEGYDCGWWMMYNALMVVLTGDTSFLIKKFQLPSRTVAYQLRSVFPHLDEARTLGNSTLDLQRSKISNAVARPLDHSARIPDSNMHPIAESLNHLAETIVDLLIENKVQDNAIRPLLYSQVRDVLDLYKNNSEFTHALNNEANAALAQEVIQTVLNLKKEEAELKDSFLSEIIKQVINTFIQQLLANVQGCKKEHAQHREKFSLIYKTDTVPVMFYKTMKELPSKPVTFALGDKSVDWGHRTSNDFPKSTNSS